MVFLIKTRHKPSSSDKELLAIDTISRLVDELIFALLFIESAQLQAVQLECESGANFSQSCLCAIFVEFVSVLAEENEISLIMQGDHSSSREVWHLWEESSQHASDSVAKHRVEVVHDKFWVRLAWCCTMTHDIVSELDTGHSKVGSRPVRQMAEDH